MTSLHRRGQELMQKLLHTWTNAVRGRRRVRWRLMLRAMETGGTVRVARGLPHLDVAPVEQAGGGGGGAVAVAGCPGARGAEAFGSGGRGSTRRRGAYAGFRVVLTFDCIART